MNPITNTKNQNAMNERELRLGYTGTASTWHNQYKDSAWLYIGGLNYDLTEGDIICVFSQYGEIVNINLVRDQKTGASKGFAFVCFEDQRSTVLASDNLNGIKLAGRIIRVDHVDKYRVPKELVSGGGKSESKRTTVADGDAVAHFVREKGCGPEVMRNIEKLQKKLERKALKRAAGVASQRSGDNKSIEMHRNPSPTRRDESNTNRHESRRSALNIEEFSNVNLQNYQSQCTNTETSVRRPSRSPSRKRLTEHHLDSDTSPPRSNNLCDDEEKLSPPRSRQPIVVNSNAHRYNQRSKKSRSPSRFDTHYSRHH